MLDAEDFYQSILKDAEAFCLAQEQESTNEPIINTFYNAPVGMENWSIKHIKPRAST